MLTFEGDYATFEDALAVSSLIYDEPVLVKARLSKARVAYASGEQCELVGPVEEEKRIFSWVFSVSSPRRVLDFGGGFGAAFAIAQPLARTALSWAVVETQQCVVAAHEFMTDELMFFADLANAIDWLGSVDMVHVDGVLHYLPEPEIMLHKLLALNAKYVALLRTVLGARRMIQIQQAPLSWEYRGPLIGTQPDQLMRSPIVTMVADDFYRIIESHGYRIALGFDGGEMVEVHQKEQFLLEKM